MKKMIFSFICLLLVAQSQARIIAVDDKGLADFNNIQAAVDDSNDGDIIEVASETYARQFSQSIDLTGRDIIIRCKDSEDISILNSISSDSNVAQAHLASGPSYVPNELIMKFKKIIADRLEGEILKGEQLDDLKLSSSLDRLNQRYKLRSIRALCKNFVQTKERMEELLKRDESLLTKREKHILTRLKRAKKGEKVPDLDRIYKLQVELEEGQSLEEVVVSYNNDPDIEYAELNYILSINLTPNDPLYSVQWPLNNTGQMYPESGRYNPPPGTPDCDINAPEAWDRETGSSKIIVGVVDTGVDYTHRDLQGNIWINEIELNGDEGVDDDGNGYIDDIYGYDFINNDSDPKDDHGHGTHCSGTIAAKGNNGLDITGVCWDARIMGLKFLSSSGRGPTSDAVEAFYYAVNNGADVLSNSWRGGGYSQSMEDAINYAYSQGVLVVASAGNKGTTSTQYPAFYEHVIAVAATNSNDDKAPFSTYGDWVEIAAPGVDILSLRASGTSMGTVYNSYTTIASGTSMACPHVSGACALLLSLYPEGTVDEVTNILKESVDPIESGVCQSGRLNIDKAILKTVAPEGKLWLDKEVYSCSGTVEIFIADSDLKGAGTEDVSLTTDGNDFETVTLLENGTNTGIFGGNIGLSGDAVVVEDGTLQVAHGQTITATYYDVNDGTGNPAMVEDTAAVDCMIPVVLDVNVTLSPTGRSATIRIESDEPTVAEVSCGLICGGPYEIIRTDSIISTSHTIKLLPLTSETDYYFVIGLIDVAGNGVVDNNEGQCYWFTTPEFLGFLVPSVFPNIQAAVDDAYDDDIVWVADGIYTGEGNRDIDFFGKAITVRSENGPDNCIIDCNGTESEPHRGFILHNSEEGTRIRPSNISTRRLGIAS
jgi:subtilisin family serine protease